MKYSFFKKMSCLLLSFALALSLAACGNGGNGGSSGGTPAPNTANTNTFFQISAGGDDIIIDSAGNEVMRGDNLRIIYNSNPYGEAAPWFIVAERYEVTGYDEYDWPVYTVYSALYDMQGVLLQSYGEGNFYSGFGDYVQYENYNGWAYRESTYISYLLNPYTGEEAHAGIYYFSLQDTCIVMYATDGSVAYITDFDGVVLDDYPAYIQYDFISQHEGYFIAGLYDEYRNYRHVLLDSTFNAISGMYYSNIFYCAPGYFICRNRDGFTDVLDPVLQEVVFSGSNISYYDGELYIFESGGIHFLCRVADNAELARTANGFQYLFAEDGSPPEIFFFQGSDSIYVHEPQETIRIINRSGDIIAEANFPTLSEYGTSSQAGSNLIIITEEPAENGYYNYACYIINGQLQIISPTDRSYHYIYLAEQAAGEYYIATRSNPIGAPGYDYLYDILDADGNIVLENFQYAYFLIGGEFLYVEWGFSKGIIDVNGNWLYQASIFDSTVDERDIYYGYM